VEGAASQGVQMDLFDAVALNAFQELTPYYTEWYDRSKNPKAAAPEHCSAFVATGSWTTDGHPVIAHNAWTDYATGARWNVIFDVRPAKGHRFLMDGLPGLIHSGDDFGINGAGILITETTIGSFHGFDPDGIPECVRARKAMQYASSIDEFAALMKEGNNGGYANTWLVADRKNGEIASLELGLKHVTLERTRDGFFVGSNFAQNEALIKDETTFDPQNLSASANARRKRWESAHGPAQGPVSTSRRRRHFWPTTTTHSSARNRPANAPCAATSSSRRAACRAGSRPSARRAQCRIRSPAPSSPSSSRCGPPWATPAASLSTPRASRRSPRSGLAEGTFSSTCPPAPGPCSTPTRNRRAPHQHY